MHVYLFQQGVIGALTYLEELVERKKAQSLSPEFDEIVIERTVPHDIVDIGGVCLIEQPEDGAEKPEETAATGSSN